MSYNQLSTIILKIFKNGKFNVEMSFCENFQTIIETSLIAHSIRNFILKNFKTEDFLINVTCEEI